MINLLIICFSRPQNLAQHLDREIELSLGSQRGVTGQTFPNKSRGKIL